MQKWQHGFLQTANNTVDSIDWRPSLISIRTWQKKKPQPKCTACSGCYLSCWFQSLSTHYCCTTTSSSWACTCLVSFWNVNLAPFAAWPSWLHSSFFVTVALAGVSSGLMIVMQVKSIVGTPRDLSSLSTILNVQIFHMFLTPLHCPISLLRL